MRNKKIMFFISFFLVLSLLIYTINGILNNAKLTENGYVSTGHFPIYPKIDFTNKTQVQMQQIKRGEFLITAGDCIACHTVTSGNHQAFSGGLPMQTPFGVIYSSNITGDRETGIGKWTDKQFVTAMREGISPKGYYYYPAFPYLYFEKLTTTDLLAIKMYLNAIPAVKQQNKTADMIWPFNFRWIQLGWRILFFYPHRTGPYQYDMQQSAQWNQGKYLVRGPGHCGMCHTPSYYLLNPSISLGAPIKKYDLTGADIEGYLAPNITRSNLGAIPDAELLKIFTQYSLIGGAPVQGPMAEAIHDSLTRLSKPTILSMFQYLKTVQSELPPISLTGETDIGKSIYNNYCSACHQAGIGGAPRFGNASGWKALATGGVEKLYQIAINGGGNMPAKGTCITCSDYDIKLAVDYIVSSSIKNTHQLVQRSNPALTYQQIYQNNCSQCHSNPKESAPQLDNTLIWGQIDKKGFLKIYQNIMQGKNHHPQHAGCIKCTDREIISALKYIMQKGNPEKNYELW